ncbi:cytochrome b561 [Variovorax boronicumulans]|jgi:cytochrome b561|uniref:Cytochrome b561 n=1 Tax=Variovorax boronicumulans TaxID=436515 RepID=A0AAW8CZP0_9BURK|nr:MULTISPECIES: cytochrome b [Variovorax]MDP9894360.1 cytochrome b561 [Variovorax boronicumulans]MDP9992719.1 cytochrome b561 [Variovorax boronicumulans]MDQ0004190.1 cytochrome b561 [Variovorax boronicumulans]MDQ0033036.1 cytochrome b561 [Variovorax boronicumulans]MDQ0039553.1 cytochrome b561 [Variovorax boronicumulans]
MPKQENRYTRTAIVLHWAIALLMALNIALILLVNYYPDEWVRPAIDTHKSTGITVLGLVILRLLWRATHRPPAMPGSYGRIERFGAHAAHGVLYLLMILLPLSGWMHDSAWKDAATHPMQLFGLFEWPRIGWISGIEPVLKETWHTVLGGVHTWAGYVFYVLFALHVLGALKHQFFDGEAELQRMLP